MNPQELLEAIALRTTFLMIDIPKNAMHHTVPVEFEGLSIKCTCRI